MDGYSIILADPPWKYGDRGSRMAPDHAGKGRSYSHYQVLDVDAICSQLVCAPTYVNGERTQGLAHGKVSWLAAESALLGLWSPASMLLDGDTTKVARAWGFEPKQVVPWIKTTADGTRPRLGGGHYTRVVAEYLVLAVRGSVKVKRRDVPGVIFAPRREHSRKPDEQYSMLEALYDGPRLELYARHQQPGWEAWGDQLQGG